MKRESVSVSLPAELAEFARQDMSVGAYGNMSEYVGELLRKRREERIAQDVQFLQRATAKAPAEEPGQAFFDRVSSLQKEVRRARKRHR